MTTIRSRLLLFTSLCVSLLVVFGFLTFNAFHNYTALEQGKEHSLQIADAVQNHQRKSLSSEQVQSWEKQAKSLIPDFRGKALITALQNPTNENVQVLIKTESEYRRHSNQLMQYFQKRIHYFGLITLGSALILCLSLLYFVFRQVFAPMEDLARRMIDFLNNKYSYQFTVPAPDEVGRLHATFNAMAQKVLQQIEDLKSLDKAKTEFLSIASHELRTPLTSIKGSLSLLNSGVAGGVSDIAKNLMTIALSETDRLIRIINELLDLAKIEARQFPLNCQWVWAHDLIEKTFAGLTGFCQEAQVHLEHNDCKEMDLWIDQDRLHQVLTNLLSNAVKFSPKGSTVRVQFLVDENAHLRIEVSDQGRGIAPEDQELIFEKFRQATSAQNPLVKGTGLGLTIAKALVEQHGGQIGVRSTPGQGATFYFTIPKWQNHVATDKHASSGAA